jgi:transposase
MARLTEEAVVDVRSSIAAGARIKDVAWKHGVSKSTIERVLRGETWKHVA